MKSEVAFRQGNARGVAPSLEKRVDQENSDRLALISLRRGQVGSAAQKPCAPFPASLLPERPFAALLYAADTKFALLKMFGRLSAFMLLIQLFEIVLNRLMKPLQRGMCSRVGLKPLCAS